MADVPLVVPFEYRKVGITTPKKAADYSADIIGVVSCQRAHKSAERAEKRGALGEAAFYRAVLAILLEWYNRPAEPVTGDEDLPEFPPDDEPTKKRKRPAKPKASQRTRKKKV